MRDVSATSIVSAQSRQILNPSYHIKGSKQMKKTMKAVARVLAGAVIATALFATSASAHEARECIVFDARSGMIVDMLRASTDCSCAKPDYRNYAENPHPYRTDDHRTKLVKACAKCGWIYKFEAINVGGCGSWCSYPKWTGKIT